MDRISQLRKFIAADPQDYFSRHALAMEMIKLGSVNEAIEILDSVIADNPAYIGSYLHLGRLYEKTGNAEKALEVYERGIHQADSLKDFHARGELQTAIDLID
ncbi:tetratricopeptide repeat protein [Pollutibacter soli]|uniref:tetratricopeptide repeat protein n=1 Tax=Pollutibacter soli TaxID=3034157 RepID=UPI0030141543